ncbi:MAG: hypothetical protein KDD70_13840, partial [Bdellovibrionales bacterium]|nr:hypothetical protein [Bdellovibrionales bacterium]
MTESTHQRKVSHDYADTAKGYADLGIEKTFYLAYREVERIIRDNSLSGLAVDVGCGGGRSTRFLQDLGFNCVGVDVESSQIEASL